MDPTITLLVFTDGRRDCLQRTLASFHEATAERGITRRIVVNDCPEQADFADWLDDLNFFDHQLRPETRRRGLAGAIAAGWQAVTDTNYVFHLEDDFLFTRHVDLIAMTRVLAGHPRLAQMALRRQPWNETEAAAGGVIDVNPDAYFDCTDGVHHWLEHRQFFTNNPSLYHSSLCRRGWPQGPESEGRFGLQLFEDSTVRCAYWGQRHDEPWVIHIGHTRVGTGY